MKLEAVLRPISEKARERSLAQGESDHDAVNNLRYWVLLYRRERITEFVGVLGIAFSRENDTLVPGDCELLIDTRISIEDFFGAAIDAEFPEDARTALVALRNTALEVGKSETHRVAQYTFPNNEAMAMERLLDARTEEKTRAWIQQRIRFTRELFDKVSSGRGRF